jgi:predicted permease
VADALIRDLQYGVRSLRKTPGFTFIALLTLAVGIGVNTAVFTIVHALLLKPLPFPDPGRLAAVNTLFRSPKGQSLTTSVDGRTFLAIHTNASTVLTAISSGDFGSGINLVANGAAANVQQRRVSAGYFGVLRVPPMMGREFTADEDREGGPAVAILSHGLWTRVFAADPQIVGRPITLRGEPYTVVGVMPPGFTTGVPTDVWTPIHPSTKGEGGGTNYGMIARVRPEATWAQANAEVMQLGSAAAREGYPPEVTAASELIPLQQGEMSDIREPLLMLWGAVGLVLLIACVNLAGLLLARSGIRTREIATRMALGSGRALVVRQLLVESLVLALAGGVLGILVGWSVLDALKTLGADVVPVGYPIELDARVLAVTLAIAIATSVVFGLMPALHASRVDVQQVLAQSGTRGVAGSASGWLRKTVVIGEVALGVILLVSAGLLVRTFVHLRTLDPGFDPSNVITATVSLQDARYHDVAQVDRLFSDTLDRIRRMPGVESAGVALGLPYTRLLNLGFKPLDTAADTRRGTITNLSYVSTGYLEALRVPLVRGRSLNAADTSTSPAVAVVNEEFARRYYPQGDALGRRIAVVGERQIVGIVGNARATSSGFSGYADPLVTPPIIYVPASQTTAAFLKLVHTWFSPSWAVRTAGSPERAARVIREAIAAVDPLLPIATLRPMTEVQANSLASERFMMSLVLGLGAVALLLAAVGIHGLVASSVTERTRELGIRLALGASGGRILRDVVAPGVLLAAAGVVLGGAASLAAVRLLQSFLWGVTPSDPMTFVMVVITLLAVAFLASLVPALRVLRLDPASTLRSE